MTVWDKLDPGLASMYARFRQAPDEGDGGVVNAVVQFRGDLDELRALGFRHLVETEPTRALGTLHLADLERITAHDGILKLSIGREPKPMLDVSVPDIRADKVWTLNAGNFTGTTGAGVIVAIIDTGIDWQHPFLRKTAAPNQTRILRIWDTGLTKTGTEVLPPLSRLYNASVSYGVEYNEDAINTALAGDLTTVRTRDCSGHGTHVASIAAGNGRTEFKYVGVAPEADIIAVKLLYPQTEPQLNGKRMPWITRFQDAVTWVLKTVKEDFNDRPVVINCSFGSDTGPHDGFTDEEDFLTTTFAAAPGKVMVMAAGNAGNKNQHVQIDFPGAGSANIPIKLFDARTNPISGDLCRPDDPTGSLELNLYYPDGSPAVGCSLDAPDDGKSFIAGPALSSTLPPPDPVLITLRGWKLAMTHHTDNQTLRAGPTVHRNLFKVEFKTNTQKKHWTGDYVLKIEVTAAMTLHLWVEQSFGYGLGINPLLTPDEVVTDSANQALIGPGAGSVNVITVASYNAEKAPFDPAGSTSRGPLVRYDNGAGIPATPPKPDIAAPGVSIDAAQSRDSEGAKKKYKRAAQMGGTSMASPHVAGAVALILKKKPTLTVQDVVTILKNNVRQDRPTNTPNDTGAGEIDVKSAFDKTPA